MLKRSIFDLQRYSPTRRFWMLQSVFWGWYFLIMLFAIVLPRNHLPVKGVQHLLLETLVGLLLAVVLWVIFKHVKEWRRVPQFLFSFIPILLCAGVWTLMKWVAFYYVFDNVFRMPSVKGFGEWYLYSFATMSVCYLMYICIQYHFLFITQREQTLKANALQKDAQLKMLRYQMNPHFMLNTLNVMSTLILKEENTAAIKILDQLSNIVSVALDQSPSDKVLLSSEIHLLNQFIGIEKTRFSDRIQCRLNIEPACNNAYVPSMVLQPILENAIKYAVANKKQGGQIAIAAYRKEDMLIMTVEDDGPENENAASSKGRGIALNNIQQRLATLYQKQSIEMIKNEHTGLTVKVTIPFETAIQ